MAFIREEAVRCREQSLRDIYDHADAWIRKLYLENSLEDTSLKRPLGSFVHLRLWDSLLNWAKCPDKDLVSMLKDGFPMVGKVARSRRWPRVSFDHPAVDSETFLQERAC